MQTSVITNTLLLTLMLVTGSAWAEWVKVEETNEVNFYINPATIRKDGNLRKVWEIQDLKQRNKDGVMSRRIKSEYDCKDERLRYLSISHHSEPMVSGPILKSFDFGNSDPWTEIPPNTAIDTILKIVCAR